MENRIEYFRKLYSDDKLIKAASYLIWYYERFFDEKLKDVHAKERFVEYLKSTDYHGIDILEDETLFDTEVIPKLLKLNLTFLNYERTKIVESIRSFLFSEPMDYIKWYVLEKSYRAYKTFNGIDDRDRKNGYDFRENKIIRRKFREFIRSITN